MPANPDDYRHSPGRTYRYWLYEPDSGTIFFRTVEDRDACLEESLALSRDEGEWPDEVEEICAGEVTLIATQIDRVERPATLDSDTDGDDDDGNPWPAGCEYRCAYALRPLPPARPASSPRLATYTPWQQLLFHLCDPDAQPHRFLDDPLSLAHALAEAVAAESRCLCQRGPHDIWGAAPWTSAQKGGPDGDLS